MEGSEWGHTPIGFWRAILINTAGDSAIDQAALNPFSSSSGDLLANPNVCVPAGYLQPGNQVKPLFNGYHLPPRTGDHSE